jgi:hypothetical protein
MFVFNLFAIYSLQFSLDGEPTMVREKKFEGLNYAPQEVFYIHPSSFSLSLRFLFVTVNHIRK